MIGFVLLYFGLLFGQVLTTPYKLHPDCYNGVVHPNTCCIGVTNIRLPDPENCQKFYECSDGKAVHGSCSGNLHWSVKEEYCEWPEIANCNIESTTLQDIPTTQIPDNEDNFINSLDDLYCFEEAIPSETCCQVFPSSKFPNNKHCSSYYECAHGVLVLQQCPYGLHWNKNLQKCDVPKNAQCNVQEENHQEPTISKDQIPLEQDLIIFPNDRLCYDQDIPDDKCCESMPSSKFPNKKDCSSYYSCEGNKIIMKKCLPGLHYNQRIELCSLPRIAKCQFKKPEVNIGTRIGDTPTKGQNTKNKQTPKQGKKKDISFHCLYGLIPAEECCKGIPSWQDVLLQNNDNCHTYIQCVHQKPKIRPCPSNLLWSVIRNRCEWIENATCIW